MKDLNVLDKLANDSYETWSEKIREGMELWDYKQGYIRGWNDCEKTRKQKVNKPASDEVVTWFDQFWREYPRGIRGKSGKQPAFQKWCRINPNMELFEKIITALKRLKETEQWQKDGGKYIPNPLTFLNQARWEDELPESKKSWNEFE